MGVKVYIKHRKRRGDEFQFFMHNFVDACIEQGIPSKPDIFFSYKWHLRSMCRRFFAAVYKVQKALGLLPKKKKALIVTANGGTIDENVFPYFWGYEIIPMLWDNWPYNYNSFLKSHNLFNYKIVFVTSRIVAERINKETSVKAFWIPEGLEGTYYKKGEILIEREKDVLELGRHMPEYHNVLVSVQNEYAISLTSSNVRDNGKLDENKLLFKSAKEMAEEISKHKVFICFPQCDTNPLIAGNVETLTQRYWEGMLSRCVLIGRAPKELMDLIGYNPVVDIDWQNPKQQLKIIIDNIVDYQNLVDENYEVALKFSPWCKSVEKMKQILQNKGYNF